MSTTVNYVSVTGMSNRTRRRIDGVGGGVGAGDAAGRRGLFQSLTVNDVFLRIFAVK